MTFWSSKPEQIKHNSIEDTESRSLISEGSFPNQIILRRCVDNFWQDNHDSLPEKAFRHVVDE